MSNATRVIVAVALFAFTSRTAFAIREFDIRTIESLGRKLYEKSQKGSSSQSELEQRAIRSAKDGLKGIDLRGYRFLVLPDPKGSGLLVYALATSRDPEEIVVGIHYRVSVPADASRVERVDALAHTHRREKEKSAAGLSFGWVCSRPGRQR